MNFIEMDSPRCIVRSKVESIFCSAVRLPMHVIYIQCVLAPLDDLILGMCHLISVFIRALPWG